MPLLPKVKTLKKGDRYDLEIVQGKFKIYVMEKYKTFQLMGDILVGLFFIIGSVLKLTGVPEIYGSISYLIGSLSLTIRPSVKIIRSTWIYKITKKKKLRR